MRYIYFIIATLSLLFPHQICAQAKNPFPKLFLNCTFVCYPDYIRNELNTFRFVRDRFEADIEILVNGLESANGGSTYFINFRGRGSYAHVQDSIRFNVNNFDTEDQKRRKLLKALQIGLMRIIPSSEVFNLIQIEIAKSDTLVEDFKTDPWNNYVFHIGSSFFTSGESLTSRLDTWSWLVMNRITHASKINSWLEYNLVQTVYNLTEDNIIRVKTHHLDYRFIYVKSVTEHWSVGGIAQYNESVFRNLKNMYRLAGVVEYNIFPFSQSMKQQLRGAYQVGGQYFKYFNTTIYDLNEEYRPYHRLSLILDITKPWGTIRSSIFGNMFLDNFSQNSATLNHGMNLRVYKGLSVQMNASASIINDQISLARANFDESTLLLRGAQLKTNYSFNTYLEVNYTFGSINNSIVNPRLAQVD